MQDANTVPKITPPRLGQVYHRQRLFKLLGQSRDAAVTWLAGPAGAGKTTLVASYLETQALRHIWYQLDAGDADAGGFFYHLRLAAMKLDPGFAQSLPLLTPEYLADIRTFSRNFFHRLLAALPRPLLLVFDNYQDVPAEAPLHRLLAKAFDAVPDGVAVLVLSRESPPEHLARLRMNGAVHEISWADLRLTEEESLAIGRKRLPKSARPEPEMLKALHQRAGGWMAGLVLLLEHYGAGGGEPAAVKGNELLFDYFASEVLQGFDPELRTFLLHTAVVPTVTATLADTLLQRQGSAHVLAGLARRQLFVFRLADVEGGYRYHPLFRTFLLDRLERTLAERDLNVLRKRAADALVAAAHFADAAALYQACGDWPALAHLVLAHAQELFGQGRHMQLTQWLDVLPESLTEALPWLAYWKGMCRLPLAPMQARAYFARAYHAFCLSDDTAGLYLAWCGVADSFVYAWDDFGPALPWIDEFQALQMRHPEPPPELQVPVTAAALGLLLHARPEDPSIDRWAERAERLLPYAQHPAQKTALAQAISFYHLWITADQRRMQQVAEELARGAAQGIFSPLLGISAVSLASHLRWFSGSNQLAIAQLEEASRLARDSGVHVLDSLLAAQFVYAHAYGGNYEQAGAHLTRMAALDSPRRLDRFHYHYLAGWLAWLRGDAEDAWRHVWATDGVCELHSPFHEMITLVVVAQFQHQRGEVAEAERRLTRAAGLAEAMDNRLGRFLCRCTAAWFAVRDGQLERALVPLRQAFAWGAASGTLQHPWWRSDIMATLCAVALQHDIEPEYIRRLVTLHGLRPPVDGREVTEHWPWPVRLHALGQWTLVIDDQTQRSGSKKPIELLRYLVAVGGRDVDCAQIAEALWPDADGDLAHHSFETTLYRLRKLLRHDGALLLRDGRLSLDPQLCWLDLWSLDEASAAIDAALRQGVEVAVLAQLTRRLFQLYRGPLLKGLGEYWCLVPRSRLHGRVLHLLTQVAEYLHRHQAWGDLVTCCEQGLLLEETAEELYRLLIVACRSQGRLSEAVAVYRRCCRALEHAGASPSAATLTLCRDLLA